MTKCEEFNAKILIAQSTGQHDLAEKLSEEKARYVMSRLVELANGKNYSEIMSKSNKKGDQKCQDKKN